MSTEASSTSGNVSEAQQTDQPASDGAGVSDDARRLGKEHFEAYFNYYKEMATYSEKLWTAYQKNDFRGLELPTRPRFALFNPRKKSKKSKRLVGRKMHEFLYSHLAPVDSEEYQSSPSPIVPDNINYVVEGITRSLKAKAATEQKNLSIMLDIGTYLEHARQLLRHKEQTWRDWARQIADYDYTHANRLRKMSKALKDYPKFRSLAIGHSFITKNLEEIKNMLSDPQIARLWK